MNQYLLQFCHLYDEKKTTALAHETVRLKNSLTAHAKNLDMQKITKFDTLIRTGS